MNYIQIALIIIKLYPIMRDLMSHAEVEVTSPGHGAIKKQFVEQGLVRVINSDPDIANSSDQIMCILSGMIDDTAAMMKRAGEALFK